MAFGHYNFIPGQWLDACQAVAGPGQAAAGHGLPAGQVDTEVQRILGSVALHCGAQCVLPSACISHSQKAMISNLGCSYSEHFSEKGAREVHRLLVVGGGSWFGLLASYSRAAA